jgi:hypothetical protein
MSNKPAGGRSSETWPHPIYMIIVNSPSNERLSNSSDRQRVKLQANIVS